MTLCQGDLPNPGIEPWSPALAGGFLTMEPPGKHLCLVLKKFHHPERRPCPQEQSLLLPLSPWTPTTTDLLSVSMDLPVLDVSYQWTHTPCVLLCLLLSLSIVCSGSIHVVACIRASVLFMAVKPHSFSWLHNIPLHAWPSFTC